MTATASVTRSKEGVPVWDGTPSSFEEYSELCQIFEQSTPFHKRYLAGPRLLGELQGAARRHVTGKPATWLSTDNGVSVLLRHLRACLGKPQLTELTEHLNRYFRQGRRKPQESMNEYIARKCEVYLRSCQAMQRVAPYHRETIKEEPRDTAWKGQWAAMGAAQVEVDGKAGILQRRGARWRRRQRHPYRLPHQPSRTPRTTKETEPARPTGTIGGATTRGRGPHNHGGRMATATGMTGALRALATGETGVPAVAPRVARV